MTRLLKPKRFGLKRKELPCYRCGALFTQRAVKVCAVQKDPTAIVVCAEKPWEDQKLLPEPIRVFLIRDGRVTLSGLIRIRPRVFGGH